MRRIEVISASAGTGKTYRLAEILEQAVTDNAARPDAIVATTFTKKAAAELEERVRRRLLAHGQQEQAQRLGASRIGTVNAVCSQLVVEFAFELGLSPSLRVLDEPLADLALRRALSRVVDKNTQDELRELSVRLERFDWQDAVSRMIALARSNRLRPEDLREVGRRSIEEFLELLGRPTDNPEALERELLDALDEFVSRAPLVDATRGTAEAVERVRPLRDRLLRGRQLTWYEWARLANLRSRKGAERLADRVRRAAAEHDRHPQLHADCQEAIRLVHELAALAYDAYQTYKRTWGVLDFPDQELYALELLERRDVRARLEEEIDLLLVDEFQDTSPIQLAIFLRLAEVADRTVWVGDPKQAIFGFRGTDPALLDTVLAHLGRGANDEILSRQWRSRPGLVDLTSTVFASAFEQHGVAREHVVVEPALAAEDEPAGLGPVVEVWRLKSGNVRADVASIAACVTDLLGDESVRVRAGDGSARPVRPGDLAILCRYNRTCQSLAEALEALDVRVVLPRKGLLATPEGVAALAALQLFADPGDALAPATLARLAVAPERPDEWLDQLLSEPFGASFRDLGPIARLREARARLATAGAVSALDAAVEAVGVRDLCRRWGDTRQRLANLDRLRAHAVAYAAHCEGTGSGCTPAGLATHLQELAEEGTDRQAVPRSAEAVNVLTWHAAKGLEWPIVVLAPHYEPAGDVLGVQVVDDRRTFDVHEPLSHRWVRFWPDPYARGSGRRGYARSPKTKFRERLVKLPASRARKERSARQALRLLYVGWTRARDRLILSARPGELTRGILGRLGEQAPWAETATAVGHREAGPRAPVERSSEPGSGPAALSVGEHPPARLSPSALARWGPAGAPFKLGQRIQVRGHPDMVSVGEAVHGFLAVTLAGLPEEQRTSVAEAFLERWGVTQAVTAADLLNVADRLEGWMGRVWPGAVCQCEWPVQERLDGGTVVHGFVDCVVHTPAGFVVIDHKSFVGGQRRVRAQAAEHAGQLAAYASAIERATGERALACYVHFPLSGWVVELRPAQLELGLG